MSPRGRRGGGERSEDDRQRARLEREQRRAQREGRPVPRSLDDLPAADAGTGTFEAVPTSGPQGRGRPGPSDGRPPASPSSGGDAQQDPGGSGPVGRRERLAALRADTESPAERRAAQDAREGAPAYRPSADPSAPGTVTPRDDVDAPGARNVAGAPAGGDLPSTGRPGAVRPSGGPAGSGDPTRERPATTDHPAADRAATAGPTTDHPAADRAEGRAAAPPSGRPWWSTDGAAAPPPPASPRPAPGGHPTAAGPSGPRPGLSPPGAVGPTGAAPRGRGARADAQPTARDVDDWFERTGESTATGEHEAARRTSSTPVGQPAHAGAAGRPATEREDLVPLRPAGPARPSGQTPATVHTRTAPARRGVSRIAAVVVLVPLVLLVAAAIFLFQPLKGDGEGEVRVRIAPGSSVDDIGRQLADRGVVSNALAFSVRARISGDGANLKAGTLRLRRNMSYGAALTALQQDPLPPSVVRVSIPEGLSRREIASSVRRAGVTGSYLSASVRSAGFDPRDYGQPRSRRGLEGFLFPATYELQRGGATAKDLVAEQVKAFRTNFEQVSMRRARRADLSPYDVLIIASMIEREVRIPSERRLVSAVIWNRLEQDIALGIDATTRYAVRNWTRPLLQSEIDRDTPYDTRRRKGLPPTPIGSPGLAAIKAAANPARSSYLYYVVRPCGDGRHNFATTSAEFERDRAAYNAAQRRAGGDPSPSDAKGC